MWSSCQVRRRHGTGHHQRREMQQIEKAQRDSSRLRPLPPPDWSPFPCIGLKIH
jgi:hypothetical protein